jgi:selenide, water dikinase
VLGDIPLTTDDRVLVDFRTADDAGVYRWPGNGPALVQTVDFFTPVVDDPYAYGQIAAANALSDVYAMGGEPRTALAIAALPSDAPGPEVIRAIFRGGYDTLLEAGVVLLGGHTVSDHEIKFGYAVTGAIDPARMLTNASARVGDTVVLTKPLGTGIIATAIKFGRASERQIEAAVDSMTRLNRDAAGILLALPAGMVSACTDVTGFGLAGHGSELARASGVTLVLDTAALPMLEGAIGLALENVPGGGRTNETYFGGRTELGGSVSEPVRRVVFDPQTSGGLLLTVDSAATGHVLGRLAEAEVSAAAIGRVERLEPGGPLVRFR